MFAVNLRAVHQNEPAVSDLYGDPATFFENTFLTAGLTNVLRKVLRDDRGD